MYAQIALQVTWVEQGEIQARLTMMIYYIESFSVNKIVLFTIFVIVLTTLLANPAPVSLEIEDLLLIALPGFLLMLTLAVTTHYIVSNVECDLILAILFYCFYLTVSILIGFIHNVPILNVLRAIGPYLDFVPLIAIAMLPTRSINPWLVAVILISVGALQACFQLYLYFTHSVGIVDTQSVLRGRITLINPRATLPIVLAATVLPLAFLASIQVHSSREVAIKSIAAFLVMLGLFGGIVTLTRSILLSILAGWFLFFILYLHQQYRTQNRLFSPSALRFALIFICLFCLISFIPKIQMLEQGLLARFYSASFSHASDYSNGRIHEEWIPALSTWSNSGLLGWLFGIGAGHTFIVANGEERAYIHNLLIYSLVYGGLTGLAACILLYATAFKTLIIRASETQQLIYLAMAALLGSLFFYGQLFAVHKGLAFNAMLFLLLAIALIKPEKDDTGSALLSARCLRGEKSQQ